ncbi:MAG: peptidylprolyl isomerase [Planctomycetes bacterium]|nr:peptidylprolyl isomerase [Planctomycetota bacterium]
MQRTRPGLLLLCLGLLAGLLAAQGEEPARKLREGLLPPAGAVAVIDGITIDRKEFVDGFYHRFSKHLTGKEALENLISQRIIELQMKARDVAVTREDAVAEYDRLDALVKEQSKNATDLATEMRKKGMGREQMLDLLRFRLALAKLAAQDFGKASADNIEQQQWLKAKRADARVEMDEAKLPENAAARVGEDFVTREEFAGALIQLLAPDESVKMIEAHMQAKIAERLCAEHEIRITGEDVRDHYKKVREDFESDPRYQGVAFADFIKERFGMDPEAHRGSASFRREVCLARLGDQLVGEEQTARLYKDHEREFGPIFELRHLIIRGSDDPEFKGKIRSLAEARKVADDVWSRLDGASMTFEEAASLFSEDARSKFKKGEWDSFTPAQLDEVEGGASILELKVGEFSKPLLYAGGYRIVKLEQKLPVPPLSPKIAAALRKSQASALFAEAWKKSRRGYDLERLLPAGEDR